MADEEEESVKTVDAPRTEETSEVSQREESVPTLQLDPQSSRDVEDHMESINKAIDQINALSQDFLSAREKFVKEYEEAKEKLSKLYHSNKKVVDRARPFYVARDAAYRAKYEHRKASARVKKASDDLETAKDKAKKAEEVLMSSASSGNGGTSDPELLSNLNKSNDEVLDALRTRDMANRSLRLCMSDLTRTDGRLALLAQQLSKHVLRASSYFDTRDKFQRHLDTQYYRLWEKSKALQEAKQDHRDLFAEFSAISVQLTQVQLGAADQDYRDKPPDLSQFEEIQDVDSLNSSFQDLELSYSSRLSQSFEASSLQSNGSMAASELGGHVITQARPLSPDDMSDWDANNPKEIYIDYDVTFQMDV